MNRGNQAPDLLDSYNFVTPDLTGATRLAVAVALCAIAMSVLPLRAQEPGSSARADSVQVRNDCRRVQQVLQTGRPANKRSWALGQIGACGARGGRVIAELLRGRRHEVARSRELDEVVSAGLGLLDRTLYESAMDVARDGSAGAAARVQAFRILLSQVDPTSPPTYEELAEGRLSSVFFDWGPAYGEPLPSDFPVKILAAATEVANQRPPAAVKEAADVVKSAAQFAIRSERR